MHFLRRFGAGLAVGGLLAFSLAAQDFPRVLRASAMGNGEGVEVEIQTSGAITPTSQIIQGPDRIVVDFPGALPATSLRAMVVNRGPLKSIRTGLFSTKPPITRVVLDLTGPRSYQVLTSRNAVMVKLAPAETHLVNAAPTSPAPAMARAVQSSASRKAPAVTSEQTPAPPAKPPLEVSFQNGLLRIHAERATLAQVLFEVQKQTGAEIPIPAGAEQEEVAVDLGPAPPREVLTSMLNGSHYNYVFIENDRDRGLRGVVLTRRNPNDEF